jgi:hypothetical protein
MVNERIVGDLRPVRRLAQPWRRGLVVLCAALAVAASITTAFGVRRDAAALGPLALWGFSVLQGLGGLFLIGAALRESVPGRSLGPRLSRLLLAAGFATLLLVTLATWSVHASQVPVGRDALYWRICLQIPLAAGLPALLLTLLLAYRAYPTRPALVGALAGLGSGLLTDGSWRTYCEVTAPSHVLSSHVAAVALLTVAGVVLSVTISRQRR